MKSILSFITLFFFFVGVETQAQEISLNASKDAMIKAVNGVGNNNNRGDYPYISMHAWTNSSQTVYHRSLIDFDLTSIPQESYIKEAKLYLYTSSGIFTNSIYDGHDPLTESNKCYIQRITSNWGEYTVTWNNQPSVTEINKDSLAESTSSYQNYVVDVTNLVQDMVDEPQNSHGFRLKIAKEEIYTRMIFASSDSPNPELHPLLYVKYDSTTTNISKNHVSKSKISLYPNYTSDITNIQIHDFSPNDNYMFTLFDLNGRQVKTVNLTSKKSIVNFTDISSGLYHAKITNGKSFSIVKKIIIK